MANLVFNDKNKLSYEICLLELIKEKEVWNKEGKGEMLKLEEKIWEVDREIGLV